MRRRARDNLWHGVNDALRQMTEVGPGTQKSPHGRGADYPSPHYPKDLEVLIPANGS
jgi:hypothetical protein